jgi:predicted amidohydrolase YtcJ
MHSNLIKYVTVFLLIIVSVSCTVEDADIILINGKIFTSDTSRLYVEALAIRGNQILATGSNAEIEKLANSQTKRIDLKGKTVVPGFNDQHDHAAFQQSPVRLTYKSTDEQNGDWDGSTKAAILDSIAKLVTKATPGEWIAGMIGNKVFHDTSMRNSLDSIAPDNPIALQVWWGHGMVTNKKGLEAVGLSDNVEDPIGGRYDRNHEGKISSIYENAQVAFWQAIAKAYPNAVKEIMEAYGQEQLKGGITSTLFMGSTFSYSTAEQILRQAAIPQRLRIVAWPRSTQEGRILTEWPIAESHPTPTSTISGIKYLINHDGPLNYQIDTLRRIVNEALITKRQLMMHIAGDSAFNIVLGLIKESGTADQWRPLRVRIEHNMIGNPINEQRKLLRDYGILIMHTPKYNQPSPLHSLLKDEILVGISPDITTNPFREIMIITSQQTNPKENLTREQAVIAYTKTNAYAEFKEKDKGVLTNGMLADLAVLSQDIFTIPADQLPATTSVMTIVDGKIKYQELE